MSLYALHHGPLAPFALLFSFTVLTPICWVEDLNKSFCFGKLATAVRGVLGLTAEDSYDWAHVLAPLWFIFLPSLSLSLSRLLYTHKLFLSLSHFLYF